MKIPGVPHPILHARTHTHTHTHTLSYPITHWHSHTHTHTHTHTCTHTHTHMHTHTQSIGQLEEVHFQRWFKRREFAWWPNFARETVPDRRCSISKRSQAKRMWAYRGKREWKHEKNTDGGLVCNLSGVQSSRQELSYWGSCSKEKRICTGFINQSLPQMIMVGYFVNSSCQVRQMMMMMMMMMSWCLMSSDVSWHIRDKLWPMPKHGSIKSTYVRCMRV